MNEAPAARSWPANSSAWSYDPWQIGWHTFIRQSDDGKRYYWRAIRTAMDFSLIPENPSAWMDQ